MERILSRQDLAQAYMKLVGEIPPDGDPVQDIARFSKAVRDVKRALDNVAAAYDVKATTVNIPGQLS